MIRSLAREWLTRIHPVFFDGLGANRCVNVFLERDKRHGVFRLRGGEGL